MQKITSYLALCLPLSYLLLLLFQQMEYGQLYDQPFHLHLALMGLGISYLVRFVVSPTMLSIMVAIQLVALFRLTAFWLYGWPLTDRIVGSLNLAYFICYLLCIQQLGKLRQARRQKQD